MPASGVSEGTRTPDRLDHNQELYQLSYAHRAGLNLATQPSSLPGHEASPDIAYVRMIWPLEEEKAMADGAIVALQAFRPRSVQRGLREMLAPPVATAAPRAPATTSTVPAL